MKNSEKDPFALLKSLGFKGVPSADELAKVDEATGAKLLSQAMNATNVRKLQTAEAKRDSREPVTSNAGIFGSLLTQAVGRNDANRAMKRLEADAKTGAQAQKAIDAFDRQLAMDDRSNLLAGENLKVVDREDQQAHELERDALKERGLWGRHNETMAGKDAPDPWSEKQIFDARTKLADKAGLLEVETDNLVRTMDFRTKNPLVKLPVGIARTIEREIVSGVETKGSVLKELQDKKAYTVSFATPLEEAGVILTKDNARIVEEGLTEAQRRQQRAAAERAFQEAGGQGGSIIEYRDRLSALLTGNDRKDEHFRQEMQDRIAGEAAAERMTQGSMKIIDEGQSAEESLRMSGPQKHLYNLTSRLVMASVKRMSGAEVTNFQLDKYSGLLGLKPGQTAHDQINALNDQARELEVMWDTLRSGYGQVIPDYVAGNPNTYLTKEIPRMDPGPIGDQETLYPVGAQATHDANLGDKEGTGGSGFRNLGEFTGSHLAEQTGVNAAKEIVDDVGDVGGKVWDGVKSGAGWIKDKITGGDDQGSMLPQAGAAMQQRQPPMARPPQAGQGSIPVPKTEEEAQRLFQTIALIQQQSQLGQRNA